MLTEFRIMRKCLFLLSFLLCVFLFISCNKKSDNTAKVEYQLNTSSITGDHFFVSYTNERGDTIHEHQHWGWKYPFAATKPFNAFLAVEVNPLDKYVLTIRLLVDGQEVRQDTVSTSLPGVKKMQLAYTAR